jgi:hypothetical protein
MQFPISSNQTKNSTKFPINNKEKQVFKFPPLKFPNKQIDQRKSAGIRDTPPQLKKQFKFPIKFHRKRKKKFSLSIFSINLLNFHEHPGKV